MGYDFDIKYKPGVLNGVADALSRVSRVSCNAMFSECKPQLVLLEVIRRPYDSHSDTKVLLDEVSKNPGHHPTFRIRERLLFFKRQVWIHENFALQPLLVAEFHTFLAGGHAGI